MKRLVYFLGLLAICSLTTSCATIIGGSKYWANVQVTNHPNATIDYQGVSRGTGEASFKVRRAEANQFSVIIREDGYEPETKSFHKRTFRGWSFAGTVIGWTGMVYAFPLPWGVAVDGMTGAWWKPSVKEEGVQKQDYRHYTYQVNFSGTKTEPSMVVKDVEPDGSKTEKLREMKKLVDEGLITSEEFEKEKKKILEE